MCYSKMKYMIFLLALFTNNCSSQDKNSQSGLIDRQPAVADQFYPSSPGQLRADLASLFDKALPKQTGNVVAIICPHAGYVFSGQVAATSFNQIDTTKKYDNVFILGSSHRMYFEGASIYNEGNFITPLGTVKVNIELANELLSHNDVFSDRMDAHSSEHSLEVQLPFLQYKLGTNFRIIPIVLGTQSENTCMKIAKALKPYLNEKNLFVISSDFSHYPDYDDAVMVDKATADAIASNSPQALLQTIKLNESKQVGNLATSLCGWTSVLSLLYMTEGNPDLQYKELFYMNSGDSKMYGDKERVVGYYSIVVEKKKTVETTRAFSLSNDEKKQLLGIARTTIDQWVRHDQLPNLDESSFSSNLKTPCGAFVTLTEDGDLRGCIGRFDSTEPLYKVIQEMAVSSSTQDYRFPPVTPEEISKLTIEISVLTPLKKINSIDEIEMGKHGIYIKKGYSSGTFLPQVAKETGWSKEEFLGHCAQDKAHIGWDGWKTAEIYTYEAYVFSEREVK
jgi:AmmeMemoRadiSam system protein B/AmmeMemoRadiSam system protein A